MRYNVITCIFGPISATGAIQRPAEQPNGHLPENQRYPEFSQDMGSQHLTYPYFCNFEYHTMACRLPSSRMGTFQKAKVPSGYGEPTSNLSLFLHLWVPYNGLVWISCSSKNYLKNSCWLSWKRTLHWKINIYSPKITIDFWNSCWHWTEGIALESKEQNMYSQKMVFEIVADWSKLKV